MKPRLAIHKFASCDGCQLALLNAGENLLRLAKIVDIVHFAEAGPINPDADVDIALIEGSITTPHDSKRILKIRNQSRYILTIGACATSGGIQALRNYHDIGQWVSAIYAKPQHIQTLSQSTAIREHIHVDFELWGCPVNSNQVLTAIHDLLAGVKPRNETDKICLECKRKQHSCVLVSKGLPCLGPITRTGCGAICPSIGRECYGCYGPGENINTESLAIQFQALGITTEEIVKRFRAIHSANEVFNHAANAWTEK